MPTPRLKNAGSQGIPAPVPDPPPPGNSGSEEACEKTARIPPFPAFPAEGSSPAWSTGNGRSAAGWRVGSLRDDGFEIDEFCAQMGHLLQGGAARVGIHPPHCILENKD